MAHLRGQQAPEKTLSTVKTRITIDWEAVRMQLESVRGACCSRSTLTVEKKINILHLYLTLAEDGLENQTKSGQPMLVNALQTAFWLLGTDELDEFQYLEGLISNTKP